MNKKEIEALALEAAKGIKSEQDLNDFRRMMTKITVEAALNAELDEHLGYSSALWTPFIRSFTWTALSSKFARTNR